MLNYFMLLILTHEMLMASDSRVTHDPRESARGATLATTTAIKATEENPCERTAWYDIICLVCQIRMRIVAEASREQHQNSNINLNSFH